MSVAATTATAHSLSVPVFLSVRPSAGERRGEREESWRVNGSTGARLSPTNHSCHLISHTHKPCCRRHAPPLPLSREGKREKETTVSLTRLLALALQCEASNVRPSNTATATRSGKMKRKQRLTDRPTDRRAGLLLLLRLMKRKHTIVRLSAVKAKEKERERERRWLRCT